MNTRPANHYVVVGTIDGIVDTSGPTGAPTVDIRLDGKPVENVQLRDGDDGIEVTALAEQFADLRSVRLRLTLPRVNVGAGATAFAPPSAVLILWKGPCTSTRCGQSAGRPTRSRPDQVPTARRFPSVAHISDGVIVEISQYRYCA